mmetsp:Transcript_13659/g.31749  ORF Transcript_13659/g.31749 Transcript_13659/m.31749 type:complete len:164 (+) Transcript_13659:49-540(+)|eukprot:CAMPEP_0116824866 /NCGR_PEP_ID=MMETSP0418-20121206/1635_1 /TAXON_ID=1158023 /ORGANISM="Astrosyne radiata, Strain 13vi08-1A" /LENGTH=163 /DNA_ID=CAMNT_0004453285 /DNA_START=112 /DNA_END=603 /DNA_ORIENTATION=-
MDGILEGPVQTEKIFSDACTRLLDKMQGCWAALACDRVGHHTVKKLFEALPSLETKSRLVTELAKTRRRLMGNAMGRSVVETCWIAEYATKGEADWKVAMRKREKSKMWFQGLLKDEDDKPSTKKRKRKRKRKQQTDSNDESKRPHLSTVDEILNTIGNARAK